MNLVAHHTVLRLRFDSDNSDDNGDVAYVIRGKDRDWIRRATYNDDVTDRNQIDNFFSSSGNLLDI